MFKKKTPSVTVFKGSPWPRKEMKKLNLLVGGSVPRFTRGWNKRKLILPLGTYAPSFGYTKCTGDWSRAKSPSRSPNPPQTYWHKKNCTSCNRSRANVKVEGESSFVLKTIKRGFVQFRRTFIPALANDAGLPSRILRRKLSSVEEFHNFWLNSKCTHCRLSDCRYWLSSLGRTVLLHYHSIDIRLYCTVM